ncbi:MAG: TIGR00730 family Rossman fold protein [Bacillaceae bacterium]|nr:TIGR00730 family Rossman fold protein [Bacillaceae bacterium]
MRRICVFAGSNEGNDEEYKASAIKLGAELAKRGIELVYGGSKIGLMGAIANQVLEQGGKVTGVMPRGLFRGEVVHQALTNLIEVEDMHERKATMNKLADGFIALPGGFGTFEELFEVISWNQIGIHKKPIAVLNVKDYYTPLLTMIDHAVESGFAKASHKEILIAEREPEALLHHMERYEVPELEPKWDVIEKAGDEN